MTRQKIGSILTGIVAASFVGTSALHGTGYSATIQLAEQGPAQLRALAPALWLAFSLTLLVLGLIIGVVAIRPAATGRLILVISASYPIGAAMLQLRFLGFIPPTGLLLGVGALALVAAGVLPRTGRPATGVAA